MAGGVAPFYRVREAVEGSRGGAVRGNSRRRVIDAGYGSGGEGAAA
jgi:hypothetical protein